MDLTKALPPAQKPDHAGSKSDDIPREPDKGTTSNVANSAAGNAGRAQQFQTLQRTIGNAHVNRMIAGAVARKAVKEEQLADVYGDEEVDQAKHAAHATPAIRR